MTSEALKKAIAKIRYLGEKENAYRDWEKPSEKAKAMATQWLELIAENHGDLPEGIDESSVNGIFMTFGTWKQGFVIVEIHNEDPDCDPSDDPLNPTAICAFASRDASKKTVCWKLNVADMTTKHAKDFIECFGIAKNNKCADTEAIYSLMEEKGYIVF